MLFSLLVIKDELLQEVVKEMFRLANVKALAVPDLNRAHSMLKTLAFDILIADNHLNQLPEGFAVQLKKSHPSITTVVIYERGQRCNLDSVDYYLQVPFTPEKLSHLVGIISAAKSSSIRYQRNSMPRRIATAGRR